VLSKRATRLASAPIVLSLGLLLSGCAEVQQTLDNSGAGFLPGKSTDATNHTARITTLWVDSWIVLWAVGIIAWALMIWAMVAYRRRKGENRVPVQLRYNNPIEALFTIVPFVLVIGFFAVTARDMSAIEAPVDGSRNIQVIGKQWSWDFNYTESNVHETGIQSQFAGEKGSKEGLPTLWLEKDVPVKVALDARDVIHSFWVIDFLYKKDLIPGKTNYIYFTPTKLGDFDGKCAELCGEYHSMMLFNVKVVDKAEYEAHMSDLQAQGNTGLLGTDLNRNQNLPGDNPDIRG
jgi:cytochrome c oxidase subunit 2